MATSSAVIDSKTGSVSLERIEQRQLYKALTARLEAFPWRGLDSGNFTKH